MKPCDATAYNGVVFLFLTKRASKFVSGGIENVTLISFYVMKKSPLLGVTLVFTIKGRN